VAGFMCTTNILIDVESLIRQLKPYVKDNYNAFTKIKDTGKDIMCCCPFHEDNNPSFGIRKEPPYMYHCFGCGESGTVEDLVYKITKDDKLFNSVYFNISENRPKLDIEEILNKNQCKEEIIEFEKYKDRYPKLLMERGISPYTFHKYEVYYDGKNIVIPIRDVTGKVRFKQLRGLYEKIYINSVDIDKKDILYGLYYLVNSEKVFDSVYVVEGTFDAMACYQAGLPAVALMGNVLFSEQLKLLSRYFKTVNLFLDNDDAGISGQKKAYELILKSKSPLRVNVVEYPDKSKDANDLLKRNLLNSIKLVPADLKYSIEL
jgi:DNA primase